MSDKKVSFRNLLSSSTFILGEGGIVQKDKSRLFYNYVVLQMHHHDYFG
jgi:hypothetical protein